MTAVAFSSPEHSKLVFMLRQHIPDVPINFLPWLGVLVSVLLQSKRQPLFSLAADVAECLKAVVAALFFLEG